MIIHLEKEDFRNETNKGKVIVDFFATWCGPCKMLAPELEELSKEVKDVKIIKVDVDKHQELAREYGIMSVPTLLFIKDNVILKKTSGFLPKEVLLENLKDI